MVGLRETFAVSWAPLVLDIIFSVVAGFLTVRLIPLFGPMFIKANMFGIDLSKTSKAKVPEAMGMVCGALYLVSMFLFIPFAFLDRWVVEEGQAAGPFPHHKLSEFLSALLSISCMILLGFADDVLNLRWRHKLLLPTIASLPLLVVYMVNGGSTSMVIPFQLRQTLGPVVDIGPLFYLYMGALAVFCTNAINILAGINGIESGQSVVIAISIATNNIIQLVYFDCCKDENLLSLYLIIPFIAVSLGLFVHNRFPAKVFVGDTFCYFAGMTFAVVGILGRFSKTMLLFFIPQILNFLYSLPQLFHQIPCPRHRLPAFNPATGLVDISVCRFKPASLPPLGRVIYNILSTCRLVTVRPGSEEGEVEMNNLTIINFFIRYTGPINEGQITNVLLGFQACCTLLAFFIRYGLVYLVYDN